MSYWKYLGSLRQFGFNQAGASKQKLCLQSTRVGPSAKLNPNQTRTKLTVRPGGKQGTPNSCDQEPAWPYSMSQGEAPLEEPSLLPLWRMFGGNSVDFKRNLWHSSQYTKWYPATFWTKVLTSTAQKNHLPHVPSFIRRNKAKTDRQVL